MDNQITKENMSETLKELINYWFVKYNPFYFFSALCILSGVFLISRELNQQSLITGKFALAATVQTYEFFLVFGCVLLFRKLGQHRPAVILGLLEVLFIFDSTCETELLMSLGKIGLLLTFLWSTLIVVKIALLAWAFELKLAKEFFIIPAFAAFGLVFIPLLLDLGVLDRQSTHLLATWAFTGLVAIVLYTKPKIICKLELDSWGNLVLERITKGIWTIWLTICSMHLLSYLVVYNSNLSLAHFAPPALLWLLFSKDEKIIWVSTVSTILISFTNVPMFVPTLLVVSLVLFLKARSLELPRLWVGALMIVYYALYTENLLFWDLPKFLIYLNLAIGGILFLITYRLRLISAGVIGTALVLWPLSYYSQTISSFGLGILLVVIGFLSLIAGLSFNLKHSNLAK